MSLFGETHYHNTKLVEKKAPTDESIRLLDEFRKEAVKYVIERGLVTIPSIDATIAFQKRQDVLHMMMDYRIILNGKKVTNSYEIDHIDKDPLATMVDKIAKSIAVELIKDVYKETK